MAYHMLFTRDEDGTWAPQFGDKDKAIVTQECEDTYTHDGWVAKRDTKIVSFPRMPSNAQVEDKAKELNQ